MFSVPSKIFSVRLRTQLRTEQFKTPPFRGKCWAMFFFSPKISAISVKTHSKNIRLKGADPSWTVRLWPPNTVWGKLLLGPVPALRISVTVREVLFLDNRQVLSPWIIRPPLFLIRSIYKAFSCVHWNMSRIQCFGFPFPCDIKCSLLPHAETLVHNPFFFFLGR